MYKNKIKILGKLFKCLKVQPVGWGVTSNKKPKSYIGQNKVEKATLQKAKILMQKKPKGKKWPSQIKELKDNMIL